MRPMRFARQTATARPASKGVAQRLRRQMFWPRSRHDACIGALEMTFERRGSLRRISLLFALLGLAVAAATSCIRTTPFQSDPSVSGLTQKNLKALDSRRPAPRPFKLVALGDTHIDYDNLARTIDAINARDDIELVLFTGDMTNLGLLQEYEWSHEQYSRLRIPYFTVIGNHDALGHGIEIYQEMYGPLDYSFSFGGVKFVMFNSNTLEFQGAAPRREWLIDQVHDRRPEEGVILVAHHDLMSPDDYVGGNVAELYEQLVQVDGVIGVIHGHNKYFELQRWHGVPVLQCGTYEKVFFHTIVTVDGSRLSFERCQFESCEPVAPIAEVAIE
jgi:3',5'-cyclic-AMP phosphodiesterase